MLHEARTAPRRSTKRAPKRYPDECPAFEVIGEHGDGFLTGAERYPVAVYCADGECRVYRVDEVRPLTPAARALLDMVRP